jgi:hypothetical protein
MGRIKSIGIISSNREKRMYKRYVEVYASFSMNGQIIPQKIIWDKARSYEIDSIDDVRNAASTSVGGAGVRYTCSIRGKKKYLFLEERKWFVEAKEK